MRFWKYFTYLGSTLLLIIFSFHFVLTYTIKNSLIKPPKIEERIPESPINPEQNEISWITGKPYDCLDSKCIQLYLTFNMEGKDSVEIYSNSKLISTVTRKTENANTDNLLFDAYLYHSNGDNLLVNPRQTCYITRSEDKYYWAMGNCDNGLLNLGYSLSISYALAGIDQSSVQFVDNKPITSTVKTDNGFGVVISKYINGSNLVSADSVIPWSLSISTDKGKNYIKLFDHVQYVESTGYLCNISDTVSEYITQNSCANHFQLEL